jgi:hypothetical protein
MTDVEPHDSKKANPYFLKKIPNKLIISKETEVYIVQN